MFKKTVRGHRECLERQYRAGPFDISGFHTAWTHTRHSVQKPERQQYKLNPDIQVQGLSTDIDLNIAGVQANFTQVPLVRSPLTASPWRLFV
jgi:hypothetical protein